jgi:hypothetical protein
MEIKERQPRLYIIRLSLAHVINHVLEVFKESIIVKCDFGLIRLSNEFGKVFVRDTISTCYLWKMLIFEHNDLAGEAAKYR